MSGISFCYSSPRLAPDVRCRWMSRWFACARHKQQCLKRLATSISSASLPGQICDVLTRRLTVRKNPSKKGSWDAPAVTVIRLLRQIQMGPPPQEGTLAHYPVGLPHSPRVLARKYRAQRLAALGLHVMPCAEVRAAPRVLGALAGVVHSCKGAPTATNTSSCHDDGY